MRRLIWIFLLLFFALPDHAEALTKTWFVNTDCADAGYGGYTNGSDGDGSLSTCAASAGAAGAFLTFGSATTNATPLNLVTNTTTGTINLRGALVDTSSPNLAQFTTNGTWQLFITGQMSGSPGYYDATKYKLSGTGTSVLLLATRNTTTDGLQILAASNNNGASNHGIMAYDNIAVQAGYVPIIRNNIIIKTGTSTFASSGIYFVGVNSNWQSGYNANIYNNAISTAAGAVAWTDGITCRTVDPSTCQTYENTIRGVSGTAMKLSNVAGQCTVTQRSYNNLLQGSGVADYANTSTCGTTDTGTNATSDATSPNVANRNQTALIGPLGVTDFRLITGDTAAKNQGTDLVAAGKLSYTLDFIGTSRPQGAAWDIGANEMIGTGPTPTPTPVSSHALPGLGVGN